MKNIPKVTLGFISFNRLNYLRATLESARQCIQYPNLEWIVVDGNSIESGLQDYLRSQRWIDKLIVKPTKFADCLNILVQEASGDYLLLWPDDMQFIVEGNWMLDLIHILANTPSVGAIGINALRRTTIKRYFTNNRWWPIIDVLKEIRRNKFLYRRQKIIAGENGFRVRTYGHTAPGVILDGIPTLSRTKLWKELGAWSTKSNKINDLIDAGEGAAEDMLLRSDKIVNRLQFASTLIPVAADILNDEIGAKAKIRGGMRYGVYTPPQSGNYYYQIYQQETLLNINESRQPIAFENFVKPLGFQLPLDSNGDLLKSALNSSVISPIA